MKIIYIHQMNTKAAKKAIMSHCAIKAMSGGVVAAGLNQYVNRAEDFTTFGLTQSATFGAIVAGSFVAADFVAPSLTNMVPIPDTALFSGKTLEHRLIEITLASAAATAVARYGFTMNVGSTFNQLGIVIISDVIAEYIADYAHSQPLTYLQ